MIDLEKLILDLNKVPCPKCNQYKKTYFLTYPKSVTSIKPHEFIVLVTCDTCGIHNYLWANNSYQTYQEFLLFWNKGYICFPCPDAYLIHEDVDRASIMEKINFIHPCPICNRTQLRIENEFRQKGPNVLYVKCNYCGFTPKVKTDQTLDNYYSNIHYENWNISCEDEEHITLEKIKILEKL